MAQPYRIVDLQPPLVPFTGGEVMELSLNGAGSFQLPIGQAAYQRVPNTVSSGGTFLLSSASFPYGDILVTTTSAVTVQLIQAASRVGVPVSVVALTTSTPNITILPASVIPAETIMGLSSFTITNPYGAITLWPASGVGWYQK